MSKNVVVFTGGRGGTTLLRALAARTDIELLTVIINGYDDGLSTGLVRRAFPTMLGPSDFRKVCHALSPNAELVRILEQHHEIGSGWSDVLSFEVPLDLDGLVETSDRVFEQIAMEGGFHGKMVTGNLVFATLFRHEAGGDFHKAVMLYAAMLGLPRHISIVPASIYPGYLLAELVPGGILGSEAAMTASLFPIRRVFVVPVVPPSPVAESRVRGADLVLYAPGTFHSSLLPSVLLLRESLEAVLKSKRAPIVWVANGTYDNGMQGLGWPTLVAQLGCRVTDVLLDRASDLAQCGITSEIQLDEGSEPVKPLFGNYLSSANTHDGVAVLSECEAQGWL